MFKTKIFSFGSIEAGNLDSWLNALQAPGYGVRIASSVAIGMHLSVTVVLWKLGLKEGMAAMPGRTTIDEIPHEPTISYESPEETMVELNKEHNG